MASSGLVANARPSGMPAFFPARRVPRPAGRHVRVEINPGLPGRGDQRGEYPGHAVLDLPGHPGVLRRHAGSRLAFAQVGGLVDGQPRPDPVARVTGQNLLGQAGQQFPQVLPPPPVTAEQPLHPVRKPVTCPFRQIPAVRPRVPPQRPDVVQRCRDSAAPPHHPAQQAADQRVRSLVTGRGILYAGHRGRGLVLFCHENRNEPRPPSITLQSACAPIATSARAATQRRRHSPLSRHGRAVRQALTVKRQL